jgi:uncharacterized protein
LHRSLDLYLWEQCFKQFVAQRSFQTDVAHDLAHVRRVVSYAKRLAAAEDARMEIVLPAAWLHDCAIVAKDSPLRSTASALAARTDDNFLRDSGYPTGLIPDVRHAIEAHSFSAQVTPRTREAMVVQEADRLDALGAVGIARCLMLGGAMGRPLYDSDEPFPDARSPDDAANVLDHFYVKLLLVSSTMTTTSGQVEARRRTEFMHEYLQQLRWEIRADHEPEEDP